MLKALFGSAKADPYNQARDHFQKLRNYDSSDPAYITNLLSIVRLCQLAIRQRPADGDAHILLSNAYLLIGLSDPFGGLYPYAISCAAAVIYQWKTVPMHSKEKTIGNKILMGVQDQLGSERPTWMGAVPSSDINNLHADYYQEAIDPVALDNLSRLINADD